MSVPKVMRTVALMLFVAVLISVAVATEPRVSQATAGADASSTLQIILEIDHDTIPVSDSGSWLPIYLTNTLQDVGGFEISLLLDRPDLFRFSNDTVIETTIVCLDQGCTMFDTTIDTFANVPVDTAGSAASGWEFIEGRALSAFSLKLAGFADEPAGVTVPPIAPGGPRLLLRVFMEKIASDSLLDTLTDRTTAVIINGPSTSFSTPSGQTIGRTDSLHCVNPPVCDTVDTVFYTDTSVFLYVSGSRTFGDACLKGDVNADGKLTAADIIYLVNYVFKAGPDPMCSPTSGDVNCTGTVNSADIIYLVNHIFKGGSPPQSC
jgi:hypothetical protein